MARPRGKSSKNKSGEEDPVDDLSVEDMQALSPSERFLRLSGPRMEKKFGEAGRIRKELEDLSQPLLMVPDLGHQYALQALGYRGGRSMVLAAEPGAFKSSEALYLCNLARQQAGMADYLDMERALNHDHLVYYLDDPEEFTRHIHSPGTIEEAVEMMREINRIYGEIDPERKMPKVIVLDSIGGAVSKRELDGDKEIADMKVGGVSGYMTSAARVLNHEFTKTGTLGIFINHAKEKIFTGFEANLPRSAEDKMSFPGGKGVIYASSYFEILKKGSQLKDSDKVRMGFSVTSSFFRNRGRINGRSYGYDVVFGETLRFHAHTMDMLAMGAVCGLKVKSRRYWCPAIGVPETSKLNDEEMYRVIHDHPEHLLRFQQELGILDEPDPTVETELPVEPLEEELQEAAAA
jgi:RecA/RadA recombinase